MSAGRSADETAVSADATGRVIPRTVYQLAIGQCVPDELGAVRASLRQANPTWAFHLLDAAAVERFVGEEYGAAMLDRYRRIRPGYGAAKADLARYLLLYRRGGLYLDLKSTADRPLDDVVRADDSYLLSQWRNRPGQEHVAWGLHPGLDDVPGGALQQWFIAAAPGHPFLAAVIQEVCRRLDCYRPWRDGVGATGVFNVTGPVPYTRAIWPIRGSHPHRLLRDETEAGLVYSVTGGLSHRTLAPDHYSRQRVPIVGSAGAPLAGAMLAAWQRLSDGNWTWRLRWRRAMDVIGRSRSGS